MLLFLAVLYLISSQVFSNTTPLPAKIYANEGAAQFVFIKGNEKPEVTYAKRKEAIIKQQVLLFVDLSLWVEVDCV